MTPCKLPNVISRGPMSLIVLISIFRDVGVWIIHSEAVSLGYMMTSSNGNIFRVTGHLCGESTGNRWIPAQRPVKRSFDVFFDLHLNKRLSKQSWGWWCETLSHPLWRHCNEAPLACDAIIHRWNVPFSLNSYSFIQANYTEKNSVPGSCHIFLGNDVLVPLVALTDLTYLDSDRRLVFCRWRIFYKLSYL